jgi:leucyl aminopeptidase
VTLTAPTPGATVGPTARFAADATSTRAIKRVEFWVDSMRVAIDANAPYHKRVDLSSLRNGMHTVAARVFNIDGQTASTAMLVQVSRKAGRARAAAVLSAGSPALLGTVAAGPGKTQLAGQAAQGRMLQATLARCNDRSGRAVGRAQLRADGAGHLTAMRTSAGLCVMGISLPS